MTTRVQMTWVDGADKSLGLPSYQTKGAAGADLRANLPDMQSLNLAPNGRVLVPTGLSLSIPVGFEAQIRPRSGLALEHGITLPNSPGTIDSDYRGPLGVIVQNAGNDDFEITHGMRIAQIVIAPVVQAAFELCDTLDETGRGTDGFGSTGTTS